LPLALLSSGWSILLCSELWRVAIDVNFLWGTTLERNLAAIGRSWGSGSWLEEIWVRKGSR
jgi:hypothetical protein